MVFGHLPYRNPDLVCVLSDVCGEGYKVHRSHIGQLNRLKGCMTQDFDFMFFTNLFSPWLLRNLMGPFRIFTKIRGDIRNFVFIASVSCSPVSIHRRLIIAGVVDTADSTLFRIFIDSMTPAKSYRWYHSDVIASILKLYFLKTRV